MINLQSDPRDIIAQLQKMERFDQVAQAHMRQAMGDVVGDFAPAWQGNVPRLSGAYGDSIVGKVTRVVGVEAKGIVSTDVSRDGFPYPSVLETAQQIRSSPNPLRRRVRDLAESKIEQYVGRFWQAVERILNDLVVP